MEWGTGEESIVMAFGWGLVGWFGFSVSIFPSQRRSDL